MFGTLNRYRKAADRITVPKAELVRLLIADGKTPVEADFQADLADAVGIEVYVGGRMVRIEEVTADAAVVVGG